MMVDQQILQKVGSGHWAKEYGDCIACPKDASYGKETVTPQQRRSSITCPPPRRTYEPAELPLPSYTS